MAKNASAPIAAGALPLDIGIDVSIETSGRRSGPSYRSATRSRFSIIRSSVHEAASRRCAATSFRAKQKPTTELVGARQR